MKKVVINLEKTNGNGSLTISDTATLGKAFIRMESKGLYVDESGPRVVSSYLNKSQAKKIVAGLTEFINS